MLVPGGMARTHPPSSDNSGFAESGLQPASKSVSIMKLDIWDIFMEVL